jgi:serine/threonine-protein kinase
VGIPATLTPEAIAARVSDALGPPETDAAEAIEPPPLQSTLAVGRYPSDEDLHSTHDWSMHLAKNPSSYDPIVLVRATAQAAQDPEFRRAFVEAAGLAQGIAHSGLPAIQEIGGEADVPFSAMVVPPGRPLPLVLRHGVSSGTPLSATAAVHIAYDLASALSGLHRSNKKGTFHLAIDPAWVWIASEGRALLLGTGLGRFFQGLDRTRRSSAGLAIPNYYEAPEDIRGMRVDARTDVYLVGVLLYELLSGAPPFSDKTGVDLLKAIREEEPAPLQKVAAQAPKELEKLLSNVLAKDPDRRPVDGGALAEELAGLLDAPAHSGRILGRLFSKRDGGAPESAREELAQLVRSLSGSGGAVPARAAD